MPGRLHDVLIAGDGPAGSALAHALRRRGVDVVLVGRDEPWTATYGVWEDDLADAEVAADAGGQRALFAASVPTVRVAMHTERSIPRPYGVVDVAALRTVSRRGLEHAVGAVTSAEPDGRRWRLDAATRAGQVEYSGRILVDATGWPARLATHAAMRTGTPTPMGWQTAWGAVLTEPPDGPLGVPTVMDWTPPGGRDHTTPTFAYALPVVDGWLVEETVLASREPVAPELLRPVLARRLGWSEQQLEERTRRIERVQIPMGAPRPRVGHGAGVAPVPYGAAAALAHPATGYQLAPALALAGSVADAVVAALDLPFEQRGSEVLDAIWTTSRRRTRSLHEFGLDVLLRLDASGLRDFFETFFAMPDDVWPAQMRIDSTPQEISSLMLAMFRAAPWRLRRRLAAGDPRRALGAVSPRS